MEANVNGKNKKSYDTTKRGHKTSGESGYEKKIQRRKGYSFFWPLHTPK
jgi:hypothetical protein